MSERIFELFVREFASNVSEYRSIKNKKTKKKNTNWTSFASSIFLCIIPKESSKHSCKKKIKKTITHRYCNNTQNRVKVDQLDGLKNEDNRAKVRTKDED